MEQIDKNYRWLLDLCGFYKGEEKDPYREELKRHEVDNSHLPPSECMKTEYRELSAQRRQDLADSSFYWGYESSWVRMMMHGGVDTWVLDEAMHFCPRSCEVDDGVPLGIKAILMNRIEHWTGYWPSDESFMQNTMEPYYRLRHNPNKIRKGKRILNAWRLERMLWYSGFRRSEDNTLTDDQETHFGLVDAVDGPLSTYIGYSSSKRFSEWKAVRMIEYAGSHGLTLTMVQDAETVNYLDLYSEHPEYKEIRELLFRHLGIEPESFEARGCEYVGRYEGKYVYSRRYDEDGHDIIGPMTCIFDEDSYEFLHVTQFVVEAKAGRKKQSKKHLMY